MIAANNNLIKKQELILFGIGSVSFGFYIIFSNALNGIVHLLLNGKISKFYTFGLYCLRGKSLVHASEIPVNEKLILMYSLTLLIKFGLLAGCILLVQKNLWRNSKIVIGALLFFNLFAIEAFSLLFYYADKFWHSYSFMYFLTAAPLYLFSKELGLALAFPLVHAALGISLPLYALKKLNLYSPRPILVTFASLFLGIISVIMLAEVLRMSIKFLRLVDELA